MKKLIVSKNPERIKEDFGIFNNQISIQKFHKILKNKDNFICFLVNVIYEPIWDI
jgi:hypothetical protein